VADQPQELITSSSHHVAPSAAASAISITPIKDQLITLLGIPTRLTGSGDVSLQLAYQKYIAFLVALQYYEKMVKAKTWTSDL